MKMLPSVTRSQSHDDQIVERALISLLRPAPSLLTPLYDPMAKKQMRRARLPTARGNHQAEWTPPPARIVVQEILSGNTVSIYWSDSQTGHYAEQIWRLGLAREDGFCVLSGRPIGRGDDVFSPRRSMKFIPANWRRMILASNVFRDLPANGLRKAAA